MANKYVANVAKFLDGGQSEHWDRTLIYSARENSVLASFKVCNRLLNI